MEENVIVIMLKDRTTGFLEKELGSYDVHENSALIFNVYIEEKEDAKVAVLRLTTERDVNDWEYEAIFDYYDEEALLTLVEGFEEEEDHFNPVWKVQFPFLDNHQAMQEKLNEILEIHKNELLSVYEVIADKEDDYSDK